MADPLEPRDERELVYGTERYLVGRRAALREVRDAVEEIAASSLVTSWGGLAKVQDLFRAGGKFEVEDR